MRPSTRHLLALRWIFLGLAAIAGAACESPKGRAPAPVTSSSAPAAPARTEWTVQPFGSAVFAAKVAGNVPLPGRSLAGLGKTFGGALTIDLHDLTATRGELTLDAASVEVHAFGDEALDDAASVAARDALGAKEHSRVRFAIRSVERASVKDLSLLAGARRTVSLEVVGELDLHGVKREKWASLTATFVFDGDRPTRATLRTEQPVIVSRAEHGVRPDGARIPASLRPFADALADDVSITLDVELSAANPT